MKKKLFKSLSLLSLILMGASAVTVALLSESQEDDRYGSPGSLTQSDTFVPGGGIPLTCDLDTMGTCQQILTPCNITYGSGTTGNIHNWSSSEHFDSTNLGSADVDGHQG